MALDVNTVRGQKTLVDERRCVQIIESHHPGWEFVLTPKERESAIDGILVQNAVTRAIVEQKSRYDVGFEQFIDRYRFQWLVTFEKIIKAKAIAEAFRIPLVGALYIVRDDVVLIQLLWSPGEGWCAELCIRKTETQATVNGGRALRDNAFIDMRSAKVLRGATNQRRRAHR
jgi:hypothetical protein